MRIQSAQAKRIAQKRINLRGKVWPKLDESKLWSRKTRDGFTTVPRGLPLVMKIMDALSKGKPVASVYFELWCRAFDESVVSLNKPLEMALHSGFTGQRAVSTWRKRLRILSDLGFIDIQPGSSGDMSYVLILNPYLVIRDHHTKKHSAVGKAEYYALLERLGEIGADDLD